MEEKKIDRKDSDIRNWKSAKRKWSVRKSNNRRGHDQHRDTKELAENIQDERGRFERSAEKI